MTGRAAAYTDEARQSQLTPMIHFAPPVRQVFSHSGVKKLDLPQVVVVLPLFDIDGLDFRGSRIPIDIGIDNLSWPQS